MGYAHIDNLYRNREILMFRKCFALEKVHGTSAHIKCKDGQISFFAGGANREQFVALFNHAALLEAFTRQGFQEITIYGEAYGGKMGMSATYGPKLKFVAFDVNITDRWIGVQYAAELVEGLGLEFVPYTLISTDVETIDAERDRPSVQAERNGMGSDKMREGVVLRPPIEVTKNNGGRIVAKHKRDEFKETKTPRPLDAETLAVLDAVEAIVDEWVTHQRLMHVLDKIPNANIEQMPLILAAMVEDVYREAAGEIVESRDASKAISRKTALMFKTYLKATLQATP